MKLEVSPGKLRIVAHNPEQEEAVEELEARTGVNELSVGFNVNYLQDALNALQGEEVLLCLRDAKTDMLTGRFGLGDRAELLCTEFRVPLKLPAGAAAGLDLMAAVCSSGADTLIADATVPQIAARLPAWYRQHVDAPAFLLLPMLMKGAPFALIYADKAVSGGIELGGPRLGPLGNAGECLGAALGDARVVRGHRLVDAVLVGLAGIGVFVWRSRRRGGSR